MQTVFLELIKLSLIGSLFATAVMLVRLIFPKTPKWIFCLLWGVVALRLVCPLSIESSISLVPDRIASGQIIASVGNEYIGDVDIIRENDAAYDSAVEAGRQPIYSDEGYYVVTEKDSLDVPKTVGQTLYPILSWIWAAGTVSMLTYTVVSFLVLRRKMAEATRLRDNIWQCEQVDSPFVLGFFKPKIYLPYHITDSDMVNVIAHEKAHIHRRDHWWKPIGFILLSVHWFNPVLWLAYVMLCRDIEAACDEKVIKHMEKDEMRAYSTALLNCSVNRRVIAACPLAFGEVGVKERVKTVMNYKKPAFWIVIAAVALCIVVAVCFLTDPKEAKPDVSLLEFPGLKWGMTPEEVKTALDISEDMIVSDKLDADEPEFTIFGRQYFGSNVESAQFKFCAFSNGTQALYDIRLNYPKETDMAVIRDNLIEIYGPGTDYGFTNYAIHDGTLQSYIDWNRGSNVQFGATIEDNAKRPTPVDEIIHCWASTASGAELFTEKEIDAAVTVFGSSASVPADRESVLEYLEKHVWVTVRCTDGSELENVEIAPYVCFSAEHIAFSGLLDRHTPATEDETTASGSKVDDLSVLNVPGLKWGMTPEEVKAALGVTDEQIIGEGASGYRWRLGVQNITLFGEKVAMGEFQFASFSDNTAYALSDVDLYYPDETDMDAVKEALTNTYGAPKDGTGFTRYRIRQGKVEEDTSDGIDLGYYKGASRTISYWESAAKQIDVLPADVQDKMATTGMVDVSGIGSGLDTADPATREIIQDYLQKESAVLLYCTDSDKMGKYDAPYSRNRVSFSATNYISMIQYHRK